MKYLCSCSKWALSKVEEQLKNWTERFLTKYTWGKNRKNIFIILFRMKYDFIKDILN